MSNARQRDLEDLREATDMEKQMLRRQAKQEMEKVRSEMNVVKQENLMLQEDVQNMKDAQEKSPSAILKNLVEKLRNDLAEKDKKQRAMSRDAIRTDDKSTSETNCSTNGKKLTGELI